MGTLQASRPDLAERGLHVELEVIETRRSEADFWRAFEVDAPHIFGALLAGIASAIRQHKTMNLGRLPRMADFAQWAAAGIGELGFTADEFMAAYRENVEGGMSAGIDSSPVGRVLMDFVRKRGSWSGTAADLLAGLATMADDATLRSQAWPRSPRGVGGVLRRLAPALRLQGISVETGRHSAARIITLCSRPEQPSLPSQPSCHDANDANDGHSGQLHSASWEVET